MLSQADVFIQNLAPGATQRLGLGSESLREKYPKLITCDISGYGDDGKLFNMKAYDLLVQAESGVVSLTGQAQAAACRLPRQQLRQRQREDQRGANLQAPQPGDRSEIALIRRFTQIFADYFL